MSEFPLWSDLIAQEPPAQLHEMYPSPIEKGNPAPWMVSEDEMTDAQMKRREEIVQSMKDQEADFMDRYGDRWKEVMYATATKQAMSEAEMISRAISPTPGPEMAEAVQRPVRVGDSVKIAVPAPPNMGWRDGKSGASLSGSVVKINGNMVDVKLSNGRVVRTSMDKVSTEEAVQRPVRVGDYVHAGFAVKGGAGFSGRVDKVDGNWVYVNLGKDQSVRFTNDPSSNWGERIIKAPMKNVSLQEESTDSIQVGDYIDATLDADNSVSGQVVKIDGNLVYVNISTEDDFKKIVKVPMNTVTLQDLTMTKENADSDYETYFRAMLKKHGYDSPVDIPDDKKDDFFNAVDAGYKAKNEGWASQSSHQYGVSAVDAQEDHDEEPAAESDDQDMMSAQLDSLAQKSATLHDILKQVALGDVPAWIQTKVANADKDVSAILDYMKYEEAEPVAEADEKKDAMVPLRMQAAMVIAKSLGTVKASGQSTDLRVSGGTPESIVNQAIRVWLSGSHTNEGWALGAKMLKLAKSMGIKWDEKLVRQKLAPIVLKKLGLSEKAEPVAEADEKKDAMVPLRMQAAMVIAKSLGTVKGSGQSTDLRVSGGSPEAIVNQAIRVWLSGSHTNEGWALGAKMLKLAKSMGIKWDEKLVRQKLAPITLKKLGLAEAEASSGPSPEEKLRQRQDQEKSALEIRQEREKVAMQQRAASEKIQKQQQKQADTQRKKQQARPTR